MTLAALAALAGAALAGLRSSAAKRRKCRKCRKRSSGRQVREFNGLKVAYLSGRTSQLDHEDR